MIAKIYRMIIPLEVRKQLSYCRAYIKSGPRKLRGGGKREPNKTYYIIRQKKPDCGIGSFFSTVIGEIRYAIKKGYIPYVDLKSDKNLYNDGADTFNSWEIFFKQVEEGITLEEVLQSKNIILAGEYSIHEFPSGCYMEIFENKKYISTWNYYFRKYMRFNDEFRQYAFEKYRNLINKNDKILGVLCRGTDYTKLHPKNHPIQPSANEMIKKSKEIQRQYNCNKIYLATEDYEIWKLFQQTFKEDLITITDKFLNYSNGVIADYMEGNIDKIQYGMDYMASMYILSKCNCIIAGRTGGSLMVSIMANSRFEYAYYYDLGHYQ